MKYDFSFRRDVKIKFLENYIDPSMRGKIIDSVIAVGPLTADGKVTFHCEILIPDFLDIQPKAFRIPGHDEIEALTNATRFLSWMITGSLADKTADIYRDEPGDRAGFPYAPHAEELCEYCEKQRDFEQNEILNWHEASHRRRCASHAI